MGHSPRKVLIIKTGFSEFLDLGISTTVSLGDVLICTSILHVYKEDQVTWLTSHQAKQLLDGNPYIDQLLIFGTDVIYQLQHSSYDIVVNLEKDIGLSTILNRISAQQKYGFYFNDEIHNISTFKAETQYLLAGQENHADICKSALEILYETVGEVWQGQGLVLNHDPVKTCVHDIGFNHSVGSKWPTKAWPMSHWEKLEELLEDKFTISWQRGHKNLVKYIDWIHSCRMIITSDSLGQAIGQALGKQVFTLYGPTNYYRMKDVPNVTVIPSQLNCPYMPCYLPVCKNDSFCMDAIRPQDVAALIVEHDQVHRLFQDQPLTVDNIQTP